MRVLVLAILALPGAVAADPKSTQLKMKRIEGSNLHIANEGGAINWRADITVTVELRPDKKLEAVSSGTRGEHNLWPGPSSRSTDDETAWTTRWNGTWSSTGGNLRLDFVLVDDKCTRAETMREFDAARGLWVDYKPTIKTCRATAKQTQITCTSEQIVIEAAATGSSGKKPPPVDAWRCNAKDSLDLGETPSQLVFGKTTCLQTSGGRMSRDGFQPCPP